MVKIKLFLLLILSLFSNEIYSQITTTEINVKEKVREILNYDGISNLEYSKNIEDYKRYIGLKIYITYGKGLYNEVGKFDENVINKYYTINELTQKKVNAYQNDMVLEDVLQLSCDENNKIYYLNLYSSFTTIKSYNGVILVPYFLNQKEKYENKSFVIVSKSNYYSGSFTDEATNEKIKLVDPYLYGGKWKCEVNVIKDKSDIFYIMKNNDGQIVSTNGFDDFYKNFTIINNLEDESKHNGICFMEFEEYENQIKQQKNSKELAARQTKNSEIKTFNELVKKYGKDKALIIKNKKVVIGMTKQMCIDSWGIPIKTDVEKTKNITKEVLIYGWSKRLHINNNKLTKIEY